MTVAAATWAPASSAVAAEWPPPVRLAGEHGETIQPDIAATRDGEVVAVWRVAGPSAEGNLKAAVAPFGAKLGRPQTIGDHATDHTVVPDGVGGAVALWTEQRGDYASRAIRTAYAPQGGSFGESEVVGSGFGAIEAAANGRGDVAILFKEATAPYELMVAVRKAGGRFGAPERLAYGSVDDLHRRPSADIAVSGDREVVVVWKDPSDWTGGTIFASHRGSGGGFSPPEILSRPGARGLHPQLAADAAGGAVAVWLEGRGHGQPSEQLLAFRRPGADFGERRVLTDLTGDYAVPYIGASATGEAMISYEGYEANPYGGYIRSQQVIMARIPEQMLAEPRWVSSGSRPAAAMGPTGHATIAEHRGFYGREGDYRYEIQAARRGPCEDFSDHQTVYAPPSLLQVEMREADVDAQGNVAVFWYDRGEGDRPAGSFLSVSRSEGPLNCGPPAADVAPTVEGVVRQDRLLRATDGDWRGGRIYGFRYQWRRCDTAGAECVDIPGATRATYRLTEPDVGQRVRVVVTATTGGGSAGAQSDQSAIVGTPDPLPAAPALVSVTPSNVNGDKLRLTAGPGAANDVRVRKVGGEQLGDNRGIAPAHLLVTDNGSLLSAGPGCEAVPEDPQQVRCEGWGVYELIADLGDGNDVIRNLAPLRGFMTGGDGDDTLIGDRAQAAADLAALVGENSGAGGASWIDGGPGADTIVGGADRDRLFGGLGDDSITAEAGYDLLCGGAPGSGSPHQEPCEVWTPGSGDDILNGGRGEDSLVALDGDDRLIGGRGSDQLNGGPGDDLLDGTADPDDPPASDFGFRRSQDSLDGGDGNDRLLTRDETYDQAFCGGGIRDSIERDPVDLASFDCELSDPPLHYPAGAELPPSVRLLRTGVVALRMGCDKRWTSDCVGQLKLAVSLDRPSRRRSAGRSRKRGPVPLGQARFAVRPGKSTPLKVRLPRRSRALVRRLRPARLLLTALTPGRVVAPRVSGHVRVRSTSRKRH